jgi:hypothetical protein
MALFSITFGVYADSVTASSFFLLSSEWCLIGKAFRDMCSLANMLWGVGMTGATLDIGVRAKTGA